MDIKNKMIPITWAAITVVLLLCFVLSLPSIVSINSGSTVVPTYKTLLDGSCQSEAEDWFAENFFGQNSYAKCYNQFKYSVLHEGVANDWIIGKDGFLFETEQTKTWVLGANSVLEPESFSAYAEGIKLLQDALKKEGKEFLFLLNPIKAEICTEKLPDKYQFLAEKYNDGQKGSNKELLLSELEKYGVNYIDMTEDVKKLWDMDDGKAFYSTGHHWSVDAAAASMNTAFDKLRESTTLSVPRLFIEGKTDELFSTDMDTYSLQNIFQGIVDEGYHTPVISYDFTSDDHVFLFGTSFGWEITEALYRNEGNKAFHELIYHEYFTNRQILNGEGKFRDTFTEGQEKSELNLMPEIRDSSLVILLQCDALGVYPTHKEFVDYVNANIDSLYYHIGENAACSGKDSAGAAFQNFHDLEDWGRWSRGTDCSVTVYTKKTPELSRKNMALHLCASACMEQHTCTVEVNGKSIGSIELGAQSYQDYILDIPAGYLDGASNLISFHLDGTVRSPYESGAGDDNRNMGIGFSYFALEEK